MVVDVVGRYTTGVKETHTHLPLRVKKRDLPHWQNPGRWWPTWCRLERLSISVPTDRSVSPAIGAICARFQFVSEIPPSLKLLQNRPREFLQILQDQTGKKRKLQQLLLYPAEEEDTRTRHASLNNNKLMGTQTHEADRRPLFFFIFSDLLLLSCHQMDNENVGNGLLSCPTTDAWLTLRYPTRIGHILKSLFYAWLTKPVHSILHFNVYYWKLEAKGNFVRVSRHRPIPYCDSRSIKLYIFRNRLAFKRKVSLLALNAI